MYALYLKLNWRTSSSSKKKITNNAHFNKRIKASINIFLAIFIIIFIRLVQIQIFQSNKYLTRMNMQSTKVNYEVGERGSIFDNEGKKLAFNKREYNIVVNPSLLHHNNDELLKEVEIISNSKLVSLDKNILQNLEEDYQKNKKYKIIAKSVDSNVKDKISEEILNTKSKKNKRLMISFEKKIERMYYNEEEFNRIVGFIGYNENSKDEKVGIFGLEKMYQNYLIGRKRKKIGIYSERRDQTLHFTTEKANLDLEGRNIHLTINSGINYILNDEIKKQFIAKNAREAYGVVMEADTGRIIAMSVFSKDKKALRNNIFQNQYEPGSIFKPLIVSAAMDKGVINENSSFNIGNGTITKYNHVIKESSRSVNGVLTTKDIVRRSSNVGMVLISDKFTEQEFEEILKSYGLYNKTGVDFPGEIKPYTIGYKKWDKLKKSNMAFGQGIAVTPIQMITAFTAVVNGGNLYRPYMVDKITDSNGVVIKRFDKHLVNKVISEETSAKMRKILEETVENGTGSRAKIEGYKIGGKTGTAQLSIPGGYAKNEYLASFIGFFPVDNPKYVVMAMFMRPQDEINTQKFGGAVAAPVVSNVIKRIIQKEELLSKNNHKISLSKKKANVEKSVSTDEDMMYMPNLKGMSAKEVLNLFKDTDIDVEINGLGLVVEQYPAEGRNINEINKIRVKLK